MASSGIFREIYGFVDTRKGLQIWTKSNDKQVYEDAESGLNLTLIEYDFDMWDGDKIKMHIECTEPPKVCRIEPCEPLQQYSGIVTEVTKSYGNVDDDILFFMDNQTEKWNPQIGDAVDCMLIEGDYQVGRNTYSRRCESIRKPLSEDQISRMFLNETPKSISADGDDGNNENGETNGKHESDVEQEENTNELQMEFEGLKDEEPKDKRYDLPFGLFESLQISDAPKYIMRKLNELVPTKLNYKTYDRRFHALIYLEEIEMKASFNKYRSTKLCIEPEKKRFSIMCNKIMELRPPIAAGDKIDAYKCVKPDKNYRGTVERVHEDRFILRFRKEFTKDFKLGEDYGAQFIYSRTMYQRKHAAIDYAKKKLPESFLFPKKLRVAKTLQLNIELKDDKLMLDDKEIPWFKDGELNEEQKRAVARSLKGECRPLPFIIFGPPGTGKTSTLIEIILQVYTHIKDCKILVATQSNNAANVVASRIIKAKEEVGKDMLRLVSNAALDRKSIPDDLHKYSASIQNRNIDEEDLFEIDEPNMDGIKRNCDLSYLKDFKIIVGTCVGLGVIFGSEFSNGYFTHVLIDEAAQCNECEAMIPISSINIDQGQVIMAGDPLQLPPITLSPHARHMNLDKSMLERYLEIYKNQIEGRIRSDENGFDARLVAKLRKNYRSLPNILDFYNQQFYNSELIATISPETSNEAIQLRELSTILPTGIDATNNNPFGIFFGNIEGRNQRIEGRKSWSNQQEAEVIKNFLPKLTQRKVAPEDIGIISPYFAQVKLIKKELQSLKMKKVTVGTVEEFQGEERKVILISAVKTFGIEKSLQFIFCPKRLNTAISRARMLVVVFGRAALLERDENWASLIQYCKKHETYIEGTQLLTKFH